MCSFPRQQDLFQQSSKEKSSSEKKKRKNKTRTSEDPDKKKKKKKKTGTSRDTENYVAYQPANVDTEAG